MTSAIGQSTRTDLEFESQTSASVEHSSQELEIREDDDSSSIYESPWQRPTMRIWLLAYGIHDGRRWKKVVTRSEIQGSFGNYPPRPSLATLARRELLKIKVHRNLESYGVGQMGLMYVGSNRWVCLIANEETELRTVSIYEEIENTEIWPCLRRGHEWTSFLLCLQIAAGELSGVGTVWRPRNNEC